MAEHPLIHAIAHRQERYQATFGNAGVGIAIVDLSGRWLEVNPALCHIVGYSRDEMLRLTYQDITHEDDLPDDNEAYRRLVADEITDYTLQKRYYRRDGGFVWVDLTVTLVRPVNEDPYAVAIIRDASDLRRADDNLRSLFQQRATELREIRRQRDAFFELSPEMHMIVEFRDAEPWHRRVNPAMCRTLGLTHAEVTARPVLDLVHPEDRAATASSMFTRTPDGLTPQFENRYVTRAGDVRSVAWSTVRSPGGLFYCVGRDVTEERTRRRREAEQSERLAATSKLNTLGRMAANISHEIKNPLTIIYGNVSRLQSAMPEMPEACRRMLSDIEAMSVRIVKIVDGLRGFTREASHDPREVVPLARILDETLSFCRARFASGSVRLDCAPADPGIALNCQPVQIQQVLLNLLNNAYEAVETNPSDRQRVTIRHRATADRVWITVGDNGPGVDPGARSRLFEPFFTTKQVGKGTGLGLNIAKAIVDSHDGTIALDEGADETSFVIELPRADLV